MFTSKRTYVLVLLFIIHFKGVLWQNKMMLTVPPQFLAMGDLCFSHDLFDLFCYFSYWMKNDLLLLRYYPMLPYSYFHLPNWYNWIKPSISVKKVKNLLNTDSALVRMHLVLTFNMIDLGSLYPLKHPSTPLIHPFHRAPCFLCYQNNC